MKRLSETAHNVTDVSLGKPDLGELEMAFGTTLTRRSSAKRVDCKDMVLDEVQVGETFCRSAELLSWWFGFRKRGQERNGW